MEKEKKIEDFKKQKQKVLDSKAKISEQINKEKTDLINKFEKEMSKKKQIRPSLVKKLFPNDEKLYYKVKVMTDNIYKKGRNKSSDNILDNDSNINEKENDKIYITQRKKKKKKDIKSYSIDKDNKISKNDDLKEQNILKKIEEFKKKCYDDLNKVIENEKKKEKERIEKYEKEKNEENKKKIQIEMSKERNEGNKLISDMEKDIQNKIKKYESDLRKNNN